MIGTPFISEDEISQRKVNKINKKPWEQEVRDEKGRKRLHGAFTGGFSAGYFNTVGTKEGWTTSNFKSSRNEKSNPKREIKRQDAIDFMDEEDLKDQVGETGLTTNENYRDFFSSVNNNNDTNLPIKFDEDFVDILLRESGLLELKYKNRSDYKNINNNKYYNGRLEFKDDYAGVGFIPKLDEEFYRKGEEKSDNSNIIRMDKFQEDEDKYNEYNFEIMEDNMNNIEKNKKRLRDDTTKDTQKFIKSNKVLLSIDLDFKMPKLPKDYDPYKSNETEENKKYNLDEEIKKLNPSNNTDLNFIEKNKIYEKMNANKRSEILDMELDMNSKNINNISSNTISSNSINPYFQNKFTKAEVFDFKSLNDDTKILYTKESNFKNGIKDNLEDEVMKTIPSSIEQFNSFFHFKTDIPFKNDINKISRFAKFVAEKEGLIVDISHNSNVNLMIFEQSKFEKKQFETLYNENATKKKNEEIKKVELKASHISETDQLKERIEKIKDTEIKIDTSIWKPNPILCKRFKIKDPFENKINSFQSANDENNSIYFKKGENNYSMSSLQYQLFKQETSKFPNNNNKTIESITNENIIAPSSNDIKISNNKKNVFEAMNSKVNINLFDEIFGN